MSRNKALTTSLFSRLSRTDFPTRLKSNEVEIAKERRFLSKALREGCRKRKEAWTNVSSRERMNTNIDLARANH